MRGFAEIQKKIKNEINQYHLATGRKREELVFRALYELKNEGKIRDFIYTGNLSWADIVRGVDFYVVYVDSTSYRVCRFDVGGRCGIDLKKNKHPQNQVIPIDIWESLESVEKKILGAIETQRRNWTS